jgi:hypothetical protein
MFNQINCSVISKEKPPNHDTGTTVVIGGHRSKSASGSKLINRMALVIFLSWKGGS